MENLGRLDDWRSLSIMMGNESELNFGQYMHTIMSYSLWSSVASQQAE